MFENFPSPILFAHRGASAHAPENTLPAFELALQQGADGVELDTKLSADGRVVVIHDPLVNRTTDGRGSVSRMSFAELRELDAGAWHSEPYRGTKVPSLDEVFEAIGRKCFINVEIANITTPFDGLAEKVCEVVKRHNLRDHVIFSSFLGFNLRIAGRLLPGVPRGLIARSGWLGAWARSFGFMFSDFEALHPHISDANAPQISRVHQLKRRIIVWTANTAEETTRLKNWGVDGIITDDPLATASALGRSG